MQALEQLRTVVETADAKERARAFRDWLDAWVEMLGVAVDVGGEIPIEWAERVEGEEIGRELMARPGVVERQLLPDQHLALTAVFRSKPRGEPPLQA